jgi:hypothetical protein
LEGWCHPEDYRDEGSSEGMSYGHGPMALWGMGSDLRSFVVWRVIANNQPLKSYFYY